jgi:putative endonuclease
MELASAPSMSHARLAFGKYGEDLACEELERRGYRVVARRYRTRSGELDIVAEDGAYVVFVEVKARQDGSFGDPEEAVTLQKQRKLIWMATDYLARNDLQNAPCRFDVVAINTDTTPPKVTVIPDAFRPGW